MKPTLQGVRSVLVTCRWAHVNHSFSNGQLPRLAHTRIWRKLHAATDTGGWAGDSESSSKESTSLSGLEKVIQDSVFANETPQGNWEEIAGTWVLRPPDGQAPEAIAHFLGGAFVGAAPQLSYKDFLEGIAEQRVLVIATPFNTGFDHLRTADEAQYKFDSTMRSLGSYAEDLPVYGVGHSLGTLIHLLISSRYAVQRAGNVFMSFNNKPATEVVPFLAQLSPSSAVLGPIMSQIAASPLRPTAEMMQEALKGMSPSIVRQVAPILEQFAPIYLDVTQGREEFTPSPEDTKKRIQSYYGVPRNLLIKFVDDTLDETNGLSTILQASAVASSLDMTTRTLPGDHMRPMQERLVELPPEFNQVADQALSRGGDFLGQLSKMASSAGQKESSDQLQKASEGISGMAALFKNSESPGKEKVKFLVNEIAVWMGVSNVYVQGPKALKAGDS